MKCPRLILWSLVVVLSAACFPLIFGDAVNVRTRSGFVPLAVSSSSDLEIAARFAPVFHQALGDKPRSDYITNFDFDGDWRGDNNWDHTDDKKFALRGYIYYAVSETKTHYFIHYAVFHPRDYKGGETKGRILSEIIREGTKRGTKYDPTGWLEEAGVAHENDMEGCLLVIEKHGSDLDRAGVTFIETLHHNSFSPYLPGESAAKGYGQFRLEGQRVLLYVEPKGHGIKAYTLDEKQNEGKDFLVYRFKGKAEDPEKQNDSSIGYDLLPIQTTLWARAKGGTSNITYGSTYDYGQVTINVVQAKGGITVRKITVGKVGVTFLGKAGGVNMARPPWGWFDKNARDTPLGRWFFDPAMTIKRDFKLGESFSTAYTRLPFWAN
jgi:hypothetical protein